MTEAVIQSPGVYVRGRDSALPSVTPTAIAGFVGIAQRGPIGIPQPLRGWGEYTDVFGDYIPYGHLAETVHAFFLNGGEKCWVVRTAAPVDPGADISPGVPPRVDQLARAKAPADILDRNNDPALTVEAMDEGSWGNRVTFSIDQNSSRDMPLTSLRNPAAATALTLDVDSVLDITPQSIIQLTPADAPQRVRTVRVTGVDVANRRLTVDQTIGIPCPAGTVISGRGFRMQFRYGADVEVFDQLSMTPEHPRYFVDVIQGRPDLQGHIERREHGYTILVRVAHRRIAATGAWAMKPVSTPSFNAPTGPRGLSGGGDGFRFASVIFPGTAGPGAMALFARKDRGTSAHDLRVTVEPFTTTTTLPVPIGPGSAGDEIVVDDVTGFVIGDPLTLTHIPPGLAPTTQTRPIDGIDPDRHLLHVGTAFSAGFPIGTRVTVGSRFDVVVHRSSELEPVERLRNLSGDPVLPEGARWYRTLLNPSPSGNGSAFLVADGPSAALVGMAGTRILQGGADPGMIDLGFYTGYRDDGTWFLPPGGAANPLGLASLEEVEEVSLVAIPDLHWIDLPGYVQAQRDLLRHCAKVGGRLALLDPRPDAETASIEVWPLQFADPALAKNGALYFPWVTGAFEDSRRRVPPCGFVAGQIANSDRTAGVGKAPANVQLKGVVALAVSVDREDQQRLNPAGVNCIRKFEDGQVRLFGARTLSRDERHQQVNVRRVLLSVLKTLTRNMLWAVFEPNDQQLRRRLESSLTSYLTSLVARGMTATPNPADSFYVKCDAENNPTELQDTGAVLAEIGLAIAAPAEFIVLTARRSPESLSIVEEDV